MQRKTIAILAVLLGLMIILNLNLLLGIRSINASLGEPNVRISALSGNVEGLAGRFQEAEKEINYLKQALQDAQLEQAEVAGTASELAEKNDKLQTQVDELQEQLDALKAADEKLHSEVVEELMDELAAARRKMERIGEGWLGVEVGNRPAGVQVIRVEENSPASLLHRLNGGYIREIDGIEIENAEQLVQVMNQRLPGERIKLTYVTRGGLFVSRKVRTEIVTLQRDPSS